MTARPARPVNIVAHELACAENYRASYRHRHSDDPLMRDMWAANDRDCQQLRAELAAHPDFADATVLDRPPAGFVEAGASDGRPSTVVNIPTRSGGWVVAWYPPLGSYTAAHFAGAGPQAVCTRLYGAAPRAIPTVAALEHRLGFRLPAAAVAGLLADRLPVPPEREPSGAFFPPAVDETPDPTRAVCVSGIPAAHPHAGLDQAAGTEEIGL